MEPYKFCPYCGGTLVEGKSGAYCPKCNWTFYDDPKPAVGILPVNFETGEVLVAYRGIEPYKGAIDTIGGFLDPYEHPIDCAKREAKEETGMDIEPIELLNFYTDTYGKDGSPLLVIQFVGQVKSSKQPKPMDDVARLKWIKIEDLPEDKGFKNTGETFADLKTWYKSYKDNNQ